MIILHETEMHLLGCSPRWGCLYSIIKYCIVTLAVLHVMQEALKHTARWDLSGLNSHKHSTLCVWRSSTYRVKSQMTNQTLLWVREIRLWVGGDEKVKMVDFGPSSLSLLLLGHQLQCFGLSLLSCGETWRLILPHWSCLCTGDWRQL